MIPVGKQTNETLLEIKDWPAAEIQIGSQTIKRRP